MIKSLTWKLLNRLNHYITKPRVVLGYKNYDGSYLANTRLSSTTIINAPEKLRLADNIYIGHYNCIEASAGINIEEGVQITSFVSITTHSSHQAFRLYGAYYINNNPRHKAYIKGDISIGKYSFIGPHSLILPNTKIGKGSLIAAYSYVQGEFPDFAIIAGNPAKVVGDTRKKDLELLRLYPELKNSYQAWANE